MKKHLIQLTDHFSYLEYSENDRPNIGLVIGKTGFLIIDSGNSRKCAENFLSALKKKRSQIKSKNGYLVLTHHHWDHICGAFFYEFPVFASSETCKKIKDMKKIKWTLSGIENAFQENLIPAFTKDNMISEFSLNKSEREFKIKIPDVKVNGNLIFNFEDVHCEYSPIESCHCDGQYLIFIREDNLLFIGDVLWPFMDTNQENWFYDVNKFKKMKESLLSYKADWFVESHAKPIPREKMEKWLEKILFLLEFVTEGKSLENALEVLPQQLKETSLGYDELIYSAIRNCKV